MIANIRIAITFIVATLTLITACTGTVERKQESREHRAAVINVQLGIGYLNKGDLKLAKKKLERAIKQGPDLSITHWSYALLQMRLGNAKRAEEYFKNAISLDSEDLKARNNYGLLLCNEGRVEEAQEQFMFAAVDPFNNDPDIAYTNAGICALKIPDVEMAESLFRKALKANPSHAQALYQMAKLTYNAGHYLQSRAFIQRYERVTTHTAGSLWLGYQIEYQLGDLEQAANYGQRLRQQYPESRQTTSLLEFKRNGP
jgi:type IV pilus assembly protein PilF